MRDLPTNDKHRHVGVLNIDDVGFFEEISRPWELLVTTVDAKRFEHQKTFLVTPNIILYRESFESAVRVRGLTPTGMLSLTVPLHVGERTAYWNKALHETGLPISMPGGLDARIDSGQEHLILLINLELLQRSLSEESYQALVIMARNHLLPVALSEIQSLGRWLMKIIQEAVQKPEIFVQGRVVGSLEQDMIQRLADLVESTGHSAVHPAAISKRRHGLERIYEYLRCADPASISILQLCEVAGVSRRTLEYSFREELDITPQGFIKLMRLHSARRGLLASHTGGSSVAEITHSLGIYEQGRFASEYRSLFGELPSQTMMKPAIDQASPLAIFIS
ncbi:MAG: helix-turn-helix domain-containing protein [Pseudomonadota bacterium]|nr:helix-turn-helix domain-containing protein [Pseudomonadota bacterium]